MKSMVLNLLAAASVAACVPIVGPGPDHRLPERPDMHHALPMQLSFQSIDTSADGRISLDEFIDCEVLAPADGRMPTRSELFERVDVDASGYISRSEYHAHLAHPPPSAG